MAVCGDVLLDVELHGAVNGVCAENKAIPVFKGCNISVCAGGAANVSMLCRDRHATVSLYCDGPGNKDKAWIGDLLKQTLKGIKVCFSGEGNACLKMRGLHNNQVVTRMDCDEVVQRKHRFVALEALADDCERYNVVVISDYLKGLVCPETEETIRKIIKNSKVCVVDSKRTDSSLWRGATALVPNADEAARIYSTTDPLEIVKMAGVEACYVTRSSESILFSDGKVSSEIALEKHIENPYVTGAGDMFAAGIALALGNGESFFCAGQSAMRMAQQYVSKSRKCQLR